MYFLTHYQKWVVHYRAGHNVGLLLRFEVQLRGEFIGDTGPCD